MMCLRPLFTFLFIILTLGLSSWVEVSNDDFSEEVPCSDLSGKWIIHRATCNSRVRTVPLHTLEFDFGGKITSSEGDASCTRIYPGNVTHKIPHISIVGNGNYSCRVNNTPVTSCVGSDLDCSNTNSVENLTNSFDICVLKELDTVTMRRTANSEDINNGVSYCGNPGEEEEWTLILAPEENTFASLSISNSPFFDFESVTLGTKSVIPLTITNTSIISANAVASSGLSLPFQFAGGAYPGVNGSTQGTCGTVIEKGSCTIYVEFSPTELGPKEQILKISYDSGIKIDSAIRVLKGTGI